jgi:hypothetical protein
MAEVQNIGGDEKRIRFKCPFRDNGFHEVFKGEDGKLQVEHFAPADKKAPKDAEKKHRKLPPTVLDEEEEEGEEETE